MSDESTACQPCIALLPHDRRIRWFLITPAGSFSPRRAPCRASWSKRSPSVLGHPVRVTAAGRTDAGVHARGQVVRAETLHPTIPSRGILHGANNALPPDIRILEVSPCSPDFDPRRDARLRWYRYTILQSPIAPAIGRHYVAHVSRRLDWAAVGAALERLRGEHDFAAFRSSVCTAKRTRLTMEDARHTDEAPLHHFDLRCRSFLHHMVRMLAGLLIEIGERRHPPEIVTEMLGVGRRTRPFRTVPPEGLTLMRVWYAGEEHAADAWP
jgi:tRNA pseudouridine38-40 synthase